MRNIKGSPDFQLPIFWETVFTIRHSVGFIFGEKNCLCLFVTSLGYYSLKTNWLPWHYCREDANVTFIRIIWWTSVRLLRAVKMTCFCFHLSMCLVLFWCCWLNNYCDCRIAEWAMHPRHSMSPESKHIISATQP